MYTITYGSARLKAIQSYLKGAPLRKVIFEEMKIDESKVELVDSIAKGLLSNQQVMWVSFKLI